MFVPIFLVATLSSVVPLPTSPDERVVPDAKLLKVAKLHQSLFDERDKKIDSNSQNITEFRGTLNKVVREIAGLGEVVSALRNITTGNSNNVTKLRNTLARVKVSMKTLWEENSTLKKNITAAEKKIESLQTEIISCVQKTEDGRIPQSVLPGSYAEYTLEDTLWQSQHLAAVAGCSQYWNGKKNTGNIAIPTRNSTSCTQTCRATDGYYYCSGTMSLSGKTGRVRKTGGWDSKAGYFFQDNCDHKFFWAVSELNKDDSQIFGPGLGPSYCCCWRP